MRHRSEHGTKP